MIFNGKSKRETVEKCILSDVDYYTSMELNGEIEVGTLTAPTGKQEVITLKRQALYRINDFELRQFKPNAVCYSLAKTSEMHSPAFTDRY